MKKKGSRCAVCALLTAAVVLLSPLGEWLGSDVETAAQPERNVVPTDQACVNFENAASYAAVDYSADGFVFSDRAGFGTSGKALTLRSDAPGSHLLPLLTDDGRTIPVETGYRYYVELYAKAEKTAPQLEFYAVSKDDAAVRAPLEGTLSLSSDAKGWRKQVACVCSNDLADGADTLALGFTGTDAKDCAVDAITVTRVPVAETAIVLHSPDAHETTEVLHGTPGQSPLTAEMLDARALPTQGKAFDGWYLDEACTQPFAVTGAFPQTDLSLYARYLKIQAVTTQTVDFEAGYRTAEKTGSLAATADPVHSGKTALSAELDRTSLDQTAYRSLLTTDGRRIAVTPGAEYLITYYAQATPRGSQMYAKLDFYATSCASPEDEMNWNNVALLTSAQAGNQQIFTESTHGWKQYAALVRIDPALDPAQAYLALGVYDNTGVGCRVYIDDLTVTQLNATQRPLLLCGVDEEDGVETVFGSVGEVCELPTLTRDGYVFAGWYREPTYQTKVSEVAFATDEVRVYARWEALREGSTAELSFETGYDGSENLQVADVARTGSRALHFHAEGKTGANTQYRRILDNDGNPYRLVDGATYIVTFWYRASRIGDAFGAFRFDLYRSNGRVAAEDLVQMTKPDVDLAKNDQITVRRSTDVWTQAAIAFTVDLHSDPERAQSSELVLGAFLGANGTEACGDVYIDDLCVRELPTLNYAVTLVTDETQDSCRILWGKAGEPMRLPTCEPQGSAPFEGWCYDAARSSLCDLTVYPERNLRLFARWKLDPTAPETVITFEDYARYNDFSDGGLRADATGTVALSTEQAHSGDYSLKLVSNGGWYGGQAFLYDGTDTFRVEPGATYAISYYMYAKSQTYLDIVEMNFVTSSPDSRTTSWKQQSHTLWGDYADPQVNIGPSAAVYWNSPFDQWRKCTTIFTADCTAANNALSITAWGTKNARTVYLDDITITKIDPANSYIFCDANFTGGADQVVQGRAGSTVQLTAPEREGYSFSGWYTDDAFDPDTRYTPTGTLPEKPLYLFAKWVRSSFAQGFEDYYSTAPAVDRDYELVEARAGSSQVYEGSYAMHRIGDAARPKRFSLMTDYGDMLESMQTYYVSMQVRVADPGDADGYLQIINTKSNMYPWATDLDARNVIKLSSIADGKWHQIVYQITLIDVFLAIGTPSRSDVYLDDVRVYLEGYQPAFPAGSVVTADDEAFPPPEDTPEFNDAPTEFEPGDNTAVVEGDEEESTTVRKKVVTTVRKKKKPTSAAAGGFPWWVILLICLGVVLLLGAGAIVAWKTGLFRKLRKKREKEAG